MFASTNGQVYKARPPHFDCEPEPRLGGDAVLVEFIKPRDQLLVARRSGAVEIYNYASLQRVGELPNSLGPIKWMQYFSPHRHLVAVTSDRWFIRWDLESRQQVRAMKIQEREIDGAISPADLVIYLLLPKGRLHAYDLMNGTVSVRQLDHDSSDCIEFSVDGQLMLSSSVRGDQRLVDARTWRTIGHLEGVLGIIRDAAFWPGEPRIAALGVQLVDLETRRKLIDLHPITIQPAAAVLVSPDGDMITQFSISPPSVTIWRAPAWAEIRERESIVGEHAWW
jgi:WD40 repeat protein